MPIDFGPGRWEEVAETYRRWWAGELERPIIPVHLLGADPGRTRPSAPLLAQATCSDFSVSPEALIDRIDYELSKQVFLGDAFPYFNMDCFGPGVIAAFLGGRLDNSTGQVWFFPPEELPIAEIHFEFDPDNRWFQRVRAIYLAGMEHWQGQVLMGMTDLGGNLDILSTFRPSEKLLFDLIDHPDEVKRLTSEAHEAWHQYYNALQEALQPLNPGYSDWSGIYSSVPSYMLQSDFCYMISPQMFDEFVKPELEATTKRLPRTFYHLDGIGQLNHLDSVLSLDNLDGVQWIPGDGKPDCAHWPQVYQKILEAGKLIQIVNGGFKALEAVGEQLGTLRGVHHIPFWAPISEEPDIRAALRQFYSEQGPVHLRNVRPGVIHA
jgi:5-methyltetrahydrofolate--homocysteine methyltransferase